MEKQIRKKRASSSVSQTSLLLQLPQDLLQKIITCLIPSPTSFFCACKATSALASDLSTFTAWVYNYPRSQPGNLPTLASLYASPHFRSLPSNARITCIHHMENLVLGTTHKHLPLPSSKSTLQGALEPSTPDPKPLYCGLFITAAEHGHRMVVRYALKKLRKLLPPGQQISDKVRDSAVEAAVQNGYVRVVKELFRFGLQIPPSSNPNLLALGAQTGHSEMVRLLLNQGWDANHNRAKALRDAAALGCVDIVQILLKAGANVNAANSNALVLAARGGYLDTVITLLAAGADVHAMNNSALRHALCRGHAPVVEALLNEDVDLLYHDRMGSILYEAAAASAENAVEAIQVVMRFALELVEDEETDEVDEQAPSLWHTNLFPEALQQAVRRSVLDAVQILLEVMRSETDPDFNLDVVLEYCDPLGDALVTAIKNGHDDIVFELLGFGVDSSWWDSKALRVAAAAGRHNLIESLIENGADVDAKRNQALRKAIDNGHYRSAHVLLKNGADVHAGKDEILWTAMERSDSQLKRLVGHHMDDEYEGHYEFHELWEEGQDDRGFESNTEDYDDDCACFEGVCLYHGGGGDDDNEDDDSDDDDDDDDDVAGDNGDDDGEQYGDDDGEVDDDGDDDDGDDDDGDDDGFDDDDDDDDGEY